MALATPPPVRSEADSSAIDPSPSDADPPPLYAKRPKVYPRAVTGRFRAVKWAALWTLLGLYYVLPWIRWDRGPDAPDQAILLDIPGRRAYFFALEIWPQEIYYLAGLLIFGAIALFLATAIAGRVWCGFACPQTLWTDLFMWVERLIEGDRNARLRLDAQAWRAGKLVKKLLKHAAWLVIALATGGAWICYYNDAPTVTRDFFVGQATAAQYGFTFLFTATTYLLAGWAREQVCIYMCPWPRFQAAMFDENSLIVTYEEWRGEPRGKVRKGETFAARGHCVDCTLCVQVCPTGVDIRNGQQLACIGCGLCIDACNSIMTKVGLPPELITYDSIANQLARARGEPVRTRLWRPRTLIYVALLVVVAAAMVATFWGRARTELNVLADRSPLFVRLADGAIRNGYTVKVLNMERAEKTYRLSLSGLAGATLAAIGQEDADQGEIALTVKGDTVGTFRVLVAAPADAVTRKTNDVTFLLADPERNDIVTRPAVFSGPGR